MLYFKASSTTLKAIAESGRFSDVAGFLVLARHGNGNSHRDFVPYRLSSAGRNAIHEKAGMSEGNASGVLQRLESGGFIRRISTSGKAAWSRATCEIIQGPLDLALPHELVDASKIAGVNSPLARIRTLVASDELRSSGITDHDARLDALMVLLAVYQHTSMKIFGGLNPRHGVYRSWNTYSQRPKHELVRWDAEPRDVRGTETFLVDCMTHAGARQHVSLTAVQRSRFWGSWSGLINAGLIYEAVSLFDGDPCCDMDATMTFSVRINDFHAGSSAKDGDPSLLRELQRSFGTAAAFYTPVTQAPGESMWVLLPDEEGVLVGVYRPRMRPETKDVGEWFKNEQQTINRICNLIDDKSHLFVKQMSSDLDW